MQEWVLGDPRFRGGNDAPQIPRDRYHCDRGFAGWAGVRTRHATEQEPIADLHHPSAIAGGHSTEQQSVQQSHRAGSSAGCFRQPESKQQPDQPAALSAKQTHRAGTCWSHRRLWLRHFPLALPLQDDRLQGERCLTVGLHPSVTAFHRGLPTRGSLPVDETCCAYIMRTL
jgi:hypothetical protein